MSLSLIGAVVRKDLVLYFRNRFFAVITALGLVAYIGIYYLMPATVDETLDIGLYTPDMPPALAEQLAAGGLDVHYMDSEAALTAAILQGDFGSGIILPDGWVDALNRDEKPQVKIYFSSDFPDELKQTYELIVQEMAFTVSGKTLNIEATEEVLGVDRAGAQIPQRERMVPLLAVFVLMMETLGLGSLISSEIEAGTIRAILTTPLRLEALFAGKALFGIGLAFVQVALLMALTGGFSQNPAIVVVALLIGSILVTGLGFLIASVARDIMSVMGWGVLVIVLLAIPAFGVLIPGLVSGWVRVLPSYYLVDTVFQATNFEIGWADVARSLLILLASSLAMLALGVAVLRRKFA